jgi:hypothetical protein
VRASLTHYVIDVLLREQDASSVLSLVMTSRPITVVELHTFKKDASGCMNDDERKAFIDDIARNPEAGDVIRGTGGVRKVRWAIGSKGKRGGARVIYYYHDDEIPLFLITAFAKSQKGALGKGEKNEMKRLTSILVETYRQ